MYQHNAEELMDLEDFEPKHRVFLCYSGAQKAFVEQLDKDLKSVDLKPFFDEDRMSFPIGHHFPTVTFRAIECCHVGVVILSEEFFMWSHWPMFEVMKMVECGRRIMPIFFSISPEDLSNEKKVAEWKSKWETWSKHYWRIDVTEWESAVRYLRTLNGLVYNHAVREVKFQEEIVKEVCKIVPSHCVWYEYYVQRMSQICEVIKEKITKNNNISDTLQVIGLYGVGGIGKTSACKYLCKDLALEFDGKVCHIGFGDGTSEIERMREALMQLSSTYLKMFSSPIMDLDLCWIQLKGQLRLKKVVLAIDNVSARSEICEEIQKYLRLKCGKGSIVVVTARDLGDLGNLGIRMDNCLEMPKLTEEEARALFLYHAGCKNEVDENIVMRCIRQCYFENGDGNSSNYYHPLSLEALGSQLVGRHPSEWKLQLEGEDVFNQLEDTQPHLLALKTSIGVSGPLSSNSDHENSKSSNENLEFNGTEWASSGLDVLDINDFTEAGNIAAMEKLKLCLRLGEDGVGVVQRTSLHRFNHEQCEYLADKLQMVVRSARLYFNVLQSDLGSSVDVAKVVEVFKFLLALARQVKSFVQGCCNDSWIQSAMTLTNVLEHVASIGFNLELCRVAFCMDCSATRCLSMDEVKELYEAEVEVVKKKYAYDVDALSRKIALEGPSLNNENKDLAFYLLRRLNQVKPIPGAILSLFEGNIGYDGGWIGRLYEWVKPSGQLGKGASGTVDKAMWFRTPVAKKTFYGKENPDFKAEVDALSPLSHPNVMTIFCSGMNQRGCCSVIMELMDEDLQKLMERRLEEKSSPSDDSCPSPFPLLEAVDIMLQIGEGGKYLHDQGIAHRDLKSMNILAKNLSGEDADGYVHVKVADFGLSKTKEKSTRYSTMSYNVGTSRWMAPEIIRLYGSDQGSSSRIEGPKLPFKRDVYSFGMVCLEILTGDIPFASVHNDKDVKRQVMEGKRPELPKDPQKCPPLLRELIESCWSPNPRERPTFIAICLALKYLKYLLMRSYCLGQSIKKAEQSRLNCADISDSLERLSVTDNTS